MEIQKSATTINCLPQGVCSWNFMLDGEGVLAETTVSMLKESGTMVINGQVYDIKKNGVLSGEWILSQGDVVLAVGSKASVFKRSFEISTGPDQWQLHPESALGRTFKIIRSNEVIGRISPMHPFTRRATIEMLQPGHELQLVIFSFWLVILIWRRAASNS